MGARLTGMRGQNGRRVDRPHCSLIFSIIQKVRRRSSDIDSSLIHVFPRSADQSGLVSGKIVDPLLKAHPIPTPPRAPV